MLSRPGRAVSQAARKRQKRSTSPVLKRGAAVVRPRLTDYNLHQQAHAQHLNFLSATQQAARSRAAKAEAARREATAARRKAPAEVHRDYEPVYENEFNTISSLASVMHRPAEDASDNDAPWGPLVVDSEGDLGTAALEQQRTTAKKVTLPGR